MTDITPVVGEAVAGESTKIRKQLEKLITSLNEGTFDVAELLHKVKKNGFYNGWGFTTFTEYVDTLDIKARKAQYLVRIVDTMDKCKVARTEYEPLGIAKLREISSLDADATYTNPAGDETPMSDFIVGFIEKGKGMDLEEIKQHVRTLKGLTGDDQLIWLNFSIKKAALEGTVRPALESAKIAIGTVGKDDEGMAVDASDGRALEAVCADFLSDPNNSILPEGV